MEILICKGVLSFLTLPSFYTFHVSSSGCQSHQIFLFILTPFSFSTFSLSLTHPSSTYVPSCCPESWETGSVLEQARKSLLLVHICNAPCAPAMPSSVLQLGSGCCLSPPPTLPSKYNSVLQWRVQPSFLDEKHRTKQNQLIDSLTILAW